MTENTEATTEPDTAADTQEETTYLDDANRPDSDDDLGQLRKLRRENKSLRDRLREADEAAGSAAANIDAMQRDEVVRLAGERLYDGTDVLAGREVAEFIGDTGRIDPELVTAAVAELAAGKPHLAKPPAGRPPSQTPVAHLRSGTGYDKPSEGGASWKDAFIGRNG